LLNLEWIDERLIYLAVFVLCGIYVLFALASSMRGHGATLGFWATLWTLIAGVFIFIVLLLWFEPAITSTTLLITFIVAMILFLLTSFKTFRDIVRGIFTTITSFFFGG